MRKPFAFQLMLLLSVGACGGDKTSPTELSDTTPQVEASDTLRVVVGKGIRGIPSEGVYLYKSGASVEYSYTLEEGFQDGYVIVGSAPMPLSGTFSVDGSNTLAVGATAMPVVRPEDALVLAAAEKVLTEADKESAYRLYLAEEDALYAKYSPEEARARAQAVSMKAFASADFTRVAALQEELAGQVFALTQTRATATPAAKYLGSVQGDPRAETLDVVYVNGMFNSRDGASLGGLEVDRILEEAQLPFSVRVDLVYNSSLFRSIGKKGYCLLSLGLSCLAGGTFDLAEAVSEFMHAVSERPEGGTQESQALAREIRRRRELGKPVLVITHSQGALIAREALEILGSKDPCVAVATLASPIGYFNWQAEDGLLSGFVIEGKRVGDIILRTGQNNFSRLTSDLSDQADQLVENNPHSVPIRVEQELALHALTGSYLLQSRPRSAIKLKLQEMALALAGKEECFKKKFSASLLVVGGPYNSGTSELWKVPPYEAGVDTLMGQVRLKDGRKVELTDIARHPDGSLWGTSFDILYKIDETAFVAEPQVDWNGIHPNGLEFGSDGQLYVVANDGVLALLDLDKLQYVWVSDLGEGYRSGGDIARCSDGKFFAIAEDKDSRNWLVEVNTKDGKVSQVGNGPMVAYNIFGLVCSGERMFGLTSGEFGGNGSLVEIDTATGKDRFIRGLSFDAFGAVGDRVPRN